LLEYDGTGLVGWQRQENGPSVQEKLQTALAEMCGPVSVVGASRTDAGVHALGQVASFETLSTISLRGFRRGLNSKLAPQVAVISAEEAESGFHARFSARGKRYRYALLSRPDPSPLLRNRAWHRPLPLDVAAMRAAAVLLIGERDFSAFRAAGCTAEHARREVREISIAWVDGGRGLLHIEVVGNAFLRHMVRIVVGTLVEVGEGRLNTADVAEILKSRSREHAGRTAPAHGLYLLEVLY
jgi:tRNA pseudouridine38-40 synthase